ncbi:MAG TPA: efflux RND transporter periplasmic adaptor subunit [Bacillota bacterium]|nr:efflux RND transporter periplasmic adaptor subunit [Bacillota bacterium]
MSGPLNSVLRQLNRASSGLKRKKLLFCTAAIAAIALGSSSLLWGAKKTEGGYITSTVKRGAVTSSISASGTIEPVSTVSLSFENAEIIKKIYVKVGDHVTAGQLLAEQEEDDLKAQVIQNSANLKSALANLELLQSGATEEEITKAEVNVKIARAAYDQAKANLERNQILFQAGAISRSDFDTANNSYVSAEGNLKQAEASLKSLLAGNRPQEIAAAAAQVESGKAQLQMAEKALTGARMVSPMNGIVSEINGGEGQRATANNNNTSSGSGFIVLISEALQVKAQVNEADIGRLALGQKVEFTVNAFPDKTFTGRVGSISPQAETVSNVQIYNAVVQIDENQQGLKAGMPANVTVIVDKQENVLTIPKGAVTFAANYLSKMKQSVSEQAQPPAAVRSGGDTAASKSGGGADPGGAGGTGDSKTVKESDQKQQAAVLVPDKSGNPLPRQVVLGISDLKNYAVLEGLSEGDTVIVGAGSAANTGTVTSTGGGSAGRSSASPLMPGGGGPPPR